MTKPALFTKAELDRALSVAIPAGCEVVVEKEGGTARLVIRPVDVRATEKQESGPKQWD